MEVTGAGFPGISQSQVDGLQVRYGKNTLIEREQQSAFATFLQEFKSPLIIILLVAACIALLTGATMSGILIMTIVIISSVLDFVVSYKSQKAAETLAARVSPKVRVIRDGTVSSIESKELVPGDMVMLAAGNVVPADGVMVESCQLFTNESSLTGESLPIEKPVTFEVYMGSGVVSGEGVMQVTQTGRHTKFADIVSLLSVKETSSEFEKGIKSFSLLITRIVLVLTICIFIVNVVFKHDIVSSLTFSLALAVGITPELLPMIIAVNLSWASIRMSKKGVIVKKLSAIENFGSMDILCTDKTGTLTEDRISVVKYVNIDGHQSEEVIESAYLTSSMRGGVRTPLDEAIVQYQAFPVTHYKKRDELPFDFERRRDSLVVSLPNGTDMLITKGAPEGVMDASTMAPEQRAKAMALFESLSSEGYRVLAVARRIFQTPQESYSSHDETGLVFSGFIAFIDPPKASVKAVLDELCHKSIVIKIVTGDHKLVAEKIVREVGIISLGTLDASEVDVLTDTELALRAEQTTIFARVTPVQKNRIIKALQSRGHVVGYMGDGINDAPALKTADVGISVENATDVAKESADIVLLTKDLGQLVSGVVEGRRTFANTMKYISMAISSNFGNMISMTVASVVLPFLPMLPAQILLNNLLYETSQLGLMADNVDPEVLERPTPWNIGHIKRFMFVFGLISSVFDFVTFYVLFRVFHLSGAGFQTGWFIQSFLSQVFVIFLIRSARSVWRARKPHIAVVVSAVVMTGIAWGVALTFIGTTFGFTPLPLMVVLSLVGITLCYFLTVEIAKHFFYRTKNRPALSAQAC